MKKVIIIGGGIGGLCAAIALQRRGVEAHVYEKVPKIKALGAGIILSVNAVLALRQIGLDEALQRAGQALKSMQIADEKGRTIAETNLHNIAKKYNTTNVSIHRAVLHQILLNAMQAGTLHCGKAFASLEQDKNSVHVNFEDGTSAQAHVLLAFDGIHSAVRQYLLPNVKLRYSGYTCWRAVINYVPEAGQYRALESWGRGRRFGIVPLDNGKLYWFATANARENDAVMRRMGAEDLKSYFSDFHHPVEEILGLTRDEEVIWNDIVDFKPIHRYTFGQVALAGDAAHATTPNMGQGAGMAIEDAAVLARLLSERGSVVLKEYEQLRMKRTQAIVRKSYQLGSLAQWENPWLRSVRNATLRLIPPSLQEKQMRQLYEVNL